MHKDEAKGAARRTLELHDLPALAIPVDHGEAEAEGGGGDAAGFKEYAGLDAVADREGFQLVADVFIETGARGRIYTGRMALKLGLVDKIGTLDDAVAAVRAIRSNGVHFLRIPDTYYEVLEERVGAIDPALMVELEELGILVDSEEEGGRLLQIFSEPIEARPTMFVEVIERQGAHGFGSGNIKALFEAVEREQERRGNI